MTEIAKKLFATAYTKEINKEERTIVAWASKAVIDRDKEIIKGNAWDLKAYRKHPIIILSHNYRELTNSWIGKTLWIKPSEEGLLFKAQFATTGAAKEAYQLVEDTGIAAFSVGFIPKKWEDKIIGDMTEKEKEMVKGSGLSDKDKVRIYTKCELLEISLVSVPSCSTATLTAYNEGKIKTKELQEEIKKTMEIEIIDDDKEKDIITKPEETEDFIHIPVIDASKFVKDSFRTIDIDKKKGIKAIIGKLKTDPQGSTKVQKFIFDKRPPYKWTMKRALAWVKEHGKLLSDYFEKVEWDVDYELEIEEKGIMPFKERWNKSLPECFDVESGKEAPTTFEYDLFKQFLDCEIKNIFQNTYLIPSPLLGTYLAGFKMILNEFELKETRNFNYRGVELPPTYKVIQLNSIESDDFLVEGMQFYEADEKPVIVKFMPDWYGIVVSIITSNKHRDWNKELLEEANLWAKENNYLKGEKFALNGAFLKKSKDDWESLIIEFDIKDAVKKSTNSLEKKGRKLESRGFLFIGEPGTGKTKTGRIILNNVDSTFVWVSSRDFDRGGTRALSLAFSLARDLAPTILFIEDIDTWLGGYIVDLLKTELDGLRQNKGIVTILTSNNPERLPDTLLDRPGRFHHVLRFPLPKAEFREEMICNWAGDINKKILDEIIEKTEDFSGAHIKELVDFANMIADEENIEIGKALLKSLDRLMAQRDLIAEIRESKKSLNEIYEIIKKNKELKVKIEEVELKAGAVLNRKNKTDLTNAQKLIQNVLDSAETSEEGKAVYECECLSCGWKHTSEKHCDSYKCEKCGGEMRRISRPGPGKKLDEIELEFEPDKKDEGIELDANEIKNIIKDVIKENVKGFKNEITKGIDDNFKRATGKVL